MDIQQKEVVTENQAAGITEVTQTSQQTASPIEVKTAKAEKKNQVVWYVIGVINALLVLRLLFLLLGARNVGFSSFLYSITNPFVNLFNGIFAVPKFEGGAYFDTAAVLAIIVLTLVGWGLSALIDVMHKPAPTER